MVAREMLIISLASLGIGFVIRFVSERETLVTSSAFLCPGYVVIGIFAAVPIADSQGLIRVGNHRVHALHIPRLEIKPVIKEPYVDSDGIRVDPLPNFDRLHILTLHGLIPAHGAALKLIGMDHQLLPVPETD